MYNKGLVIGKFYPPHRGHHYLIEAATAQVEHLTVIICKREGENPPGDLRADWLREIHPQVEVIAIDDIYPDDDSKLWADLTVGWLGSAPDVVFTSEDYGYNYAHFLGCQHVQVDKARRVVPCSGTAVRANPLAMWDYLEPCVRAFYAKRICLVGAESTGKTTMAEALAQHYQTQWVAEYGRDYWIEKMQRDEIDSWTSAEFVHIAIEQSHREDEAARTANKILICDTDAFATSIWHRRYMGFASPAVEAVAAPRYYDLYLLTDVNIPFVQDGFRDGEYIRHWMHHEFAKELEAQGKPYAVLSGTHAERLTAAKKSIDALILNTIKHITR